MRETIKLKKESDTPAETRRHTSSPPLRPGPSKGSEGCPPKDPLRKALGSTEEGPVGIQSRLGHVFRAAWWDWLEGRPNRGFLSGGQVVGGQAAPGRCTLSERGFLDV
jgi:hypothetical protein